MRCPAFKGRPLKWEMDVEQAILTDRAARIFLVAA
jgi:hypothetical protein